MSGVLCIAVFDFADYAQQLFCIDFCDGTTAQLWKDVVLKPRIDALAMAFRFWIDVLLEPLPGNTTSKLLVSPQTRASISPRSRVRVFKRKSKRERHFTCLALHLHGRSLHSSELFLEFLLPNRPRSVQLIIVAE